MNIVPGFGPKDAKIMLVGEAPSVTEVSVGRPFVGRAGEKLDQCLQSAGILRTQTYVTNVIKERPYNDDITKVIDLENGLKLGHDWGFWLEKLKEEILEIKPNVVVALGAVALYALTGKQHISKWRNSILESNLVPGQKVIPTYHPAHVLREHPDSYVLSSDLIRVKEESLTPEIVLPTYDFLLDPSFADVMSTLEAIYQTKDPVAFDIEVVGQEIECFSFAWSPTDAICIPIYNKRCTFTLEEEAEIMAMTCNILADPEIKVILQNAAFDLTFMYAKYGVMTSNIEDTMVAQNLLAPGMPKGLDFICSMYSRQPYYKEDGKMWFKGFSDDVESFWRYNCLDSSVTFLAFKQMIKDLERMGLTKVYRNTVAIIPVLVKMQAHGILMDVERIKHESKETAEKTEAILEQLHKVAGCPLNPNSPKQLATYFYIHKNVKPYTKDGGKMTTDEKAMKKLAAKGFEEAKLILDYRRKKKYLSTYLSAHFDSDNRLRCSFNPAGTVTGRLSSSKTILTGTGMNMQNLPHSFYQFMLIDPGYVAYNIDLAGAENRIVANCGPVPTMKNAFDRGLDVHRLTASLMFGIPYDSEKLYDLAPIGGGDASYRQWGKKMNHSSNYGIGPNKLALALEIEVSEAKKLLNAYHAQYPEVRTCYQGNIQQMLRKDRIVTNPMGRRRLFLDFWGDSLFMEAYGHFAQSTVADIINERGLVVADAFEEVTMLNQIHDSLVFAIPLSVPFSRHAEILSAILKSLETPILWKSFEFVIPAELKLAVHNLGNAEVVKDLSTLADVYSRLESTNGKAL